MKQCGFAGCKNRAAYRIRQTVGKKQVLLACEDCAPQWAKAPQQHMASAFRFQIAERIQD